MTQPVPTDTVVRVEPWPAGGWAVWIEGRPTPVSRDDTEAEARFRAAALQRVLDRGQRLDLSRDGWSGAERFGYRAG